MIIIIKIFKNETKTNKEYINNNINNNNNNYNQRNKNN